MTKKIAIIGAGPGGLTSAMILAKRGFKVTVFEKEKVVGGRNGFIEKAGYKFDIGPTFLMMKFILDEMFVEAGAKSSDYLEFKKLEPMYRLFFHDLEVDISDDADQMRQMIAKYFPGNEVGFELFLSREAKRFNKIFACLQKDYGSPADFLKPAFLEAIPHIPLGQSLYGYLGKYFNDERLKLAFTFQAKYLGMSPWQCPAFFIILSYIEHKWGVYHTTGGLSDISRAMAEVATKNGADIRLNSAVEQIIVKDGQSKGVLLADGTKFMADEIIVNADFTYAAQKLFPVGTLTKWTPEKLAKKKFSCSTLMFYWGVNETYPADQLEHHNIFFADDYRKNVEGIFKGKMLDDSFSFYIRNASLNDPTLAPAGKSALYVLIPSANNSFGLNWPNEIDRIREHIFQKIAHKLGHNNFKEKIETEIIITPEDWEEKMNIGNGATFNLAHNISQMLYFRPHNKFEDVESTWLVGGGTHPGSGLPTIYESGRITANLISTKYKVAFTAPSTFSKKTL